MILNTGRIEQLQLSGDHGLRIVPTTSADLQGLTQVFTDPETRASIHWLADRVYSASDPELWVRRAYEGLVTGGELLLSLHWDNSYVGSVNVHRLPDASAEVGYWILRPFWGRGFATEGLRLALAVVMAQTDRHTLFATTSESNVGSQRVLERNCFRRCSFSDAPALGTGLRVSKLYRKDIR